MYETINEAPKEWANIIIVKKKKEKIPKDALWMFEALGWDK